MDNVRLFSKIDPWFWVRSPAIWVPSEDTLVFTNYYVKCHVLEEQIINEIPSVINHESLHRELFKLVGLKQSESLDAITFNIEESLGWVHVIFEKETLSNSF
jgi:hypothetical protein